MKYFYQSITFIVMLSLTLLIACAGDEKEKSQNQQHDTVYTCPMHPEIRQNEKGRCPKCGMDLLIEKDVKGHENHEHTAEYTCPMHPEVKQHEKGRCPKCGMDLVPSKDSENHKNHDHNE